VTRRLRIRLLAGVGLAAALSAGQVCAFAFAGGSTSPTDTVTTTAPVTTVVAPTTTAPSVTPDAPPPPKKPKPKPKPTTTNQTHTAPAKTTVTPSAPTTTATTPASISRTTTPTHVATTSETKTPVSSSESAAKRERAALRAQVDRSKKIKAAQLKRLYTDIPKPTYPLTRAGGGEHPRTPIKHFVYLLQENHTFDNYFGTYGRGSDGTPIGTCMPLNLNHPKGKCIKPFRLGGRAVTDIGHNVIIFRGQYNHGKMNGFANVLRLQGVNPTNVMGYYDGSDIPYYWNLADQYVLFDRFFSSATDGSGSNHFFWVGAYPADPHDVPKDGFTRPTIFDELEKAGVSWKFYVSNYDPKITFRAHVVGDRSSQVVWVPLLNYARYIDDPKLAKHIVPLTQYYKDLHDGTLPAVSYIAPSGASEHPPGSVQSGMRFVRTVINNLVASPYWDSSAFLLSYDDWGGWYDHVRPPQIDGFGYGFRVPALLVSPYARRGYVDHTTLDFTSGLKFIEENWGLAPLTRRDATATSIAGAFDFNQAPRPARIIPATRKVAAPVVAKRSIIYPAYSIGAALVLLLILVAVFRTRRMRSQRVGGAMFGDADS
jgi:phospholipase C